MSKTNYVDYYRQPPAYLLPDQVLQFYADQEKADKERELRVERKAKKDKKAKPAEIPQFENIPYVPSDIDLTIINDKGGEIIDEKTGKKKAGSKYRYFYLPLTIIRKSIIKS